MTNELEKQFFDTFGIEKKTNQVYGVQLDYHIEEYPQITDRILLELICIANKAYIDLEGTDIETMKNSLLENFIFFKRDVYDDIKKLFEEGEDEKI